MEIKYKDKVINLDEDYSEYSFEEQTGVAIYKAPSYELDSTKEVLIVSEDKENE